tara:strand:- start:237 stop:1751 length:1515 start_codon:yes stop_codon:yes gene_type:complete
MKDKILFWIDPDFLQFGIAKFLQKKIEADFYAIVDLNHHLEKSFKTQKIVNFKQIWYYWENFRKNKPNPNLKYLKDFEQRYNLKLWTLIYSERIFYKYNEFNKLSSDEILQIITHDCQFFEKILDEINPSYLVIKGVDFHRNYLLAEICNLRGIKVLMLYTSRIGYRCTISSKFDQLELPNTDVIQKTISNKTFPELRDYLKKSNKTQQISAIKGWICYSNISKIKILIHWLTKTFDSQYRETYDHFGMTRYKVIKNQLSNIIKRRSRESFINKNFRKEIPSTKFLYFPMQVEPERNLLLGAPFYSNQLELIKNIAKSLPVGNYLVVKEHYAMRLKGWRSTSYYKQLLDLPNVILLHPSIKSDDVLKSCSIVLTINGSTGFEGICNNKPCIVFSDTIYSHLSFVHRINGIEELPFIIQKFLKIEVDLDELNQFVNDLYNSTFAFDEFQFEQEIFDRFHHGFLVGDNVSMDDLNSFFEEKSKILEKISVEHINKMTHYSEDTKIK